MASEQDFCRDYLLVRAEEATLFDLIRILYSSDLQRRSFFRSSSDHQALTTLQGLRRRWLLFVSVVLQKVLLLLKKPLVCIGSAIELWLNLLSCNGGLVSLLLNLLRGKVLKPEDDSSPKFRSFLGNLDARVELDGGIGKDDPRYNAALSIMAAKLSYENEAFSRNVVTNHWKMEFIGFYNFWDDYQKQASTQAIVFQDSRGDSELIVVAFRGTEPFNADDWRVDVDLSWYEIQGIGKAHRGFMHALGLQHGLVRPKGIQEGPTQYAYYALRDLLRGRLTENPKAKFMVTGHSLGGALAILFPAVLMMLEETWLLERLEGVFTFGQPRIGDDRFGNFMKEKLRLHNVKYFRYVYCNDLVPRVPYDDKSLLFKHFGPCLYFNSCYKGQVLEEEPNRNYFNPLYVVPKNGNAVWEVIRSFLLPMMKGRDYRENWLSTLARVVGLVLPGLSAHSPVDYVNLTRLGSLSSYVHLRDRVHDQLGLDKHD